jgi:hypothetical protein
MARRTTMSTTNEARTKKSKWRVGVKLSGPRARVGPSGRSVT